MTHVDYLPIFISLSSALNITSGKDKVYHRQLKSIQSNPVTEKAHLNNVSLCTTVEPMLPWNRKLDCPFK